MIKQWTMALLAAFLLAGTSYAQQLPSYYPDDGFQRVATIDAVHLERQVIVINDVPYTISDNAVVYSRSSANAPWSRLKAGGKIGYKQAAGGRVITEIWLLPSNYKSRQRR